MKQTPGTLGAIVFATLMMVCSVTAAQNLYRWVDADGKVYYSDQPPPADAKESKSLSRGGSQLDDAADDDEESPTYVDREAEFQERRKEKAEAETTAREKAEVAAQQKRNCDAARINFQNLSAGGRLTQLNAEGEREFISDEQIASQKEQASKDIQKWCGN